MDVPPFSVQIVDLETGEPVVVVSGEVDLLTARKLSECLQHVLRRSPRRIVIDLSDTTFLDCAGARAIGDARDALPVTTCSVVLRHPKGLIRTVLEMTGLDGPCSIEGDP